MAKATSMVLIRAALLVLALSVYRSEGHNKSQPTNADKSQPTNAGKANLDVNLNGAFHTVFAFGESGTDTGNARLMGTLQNFVGSWLHAMHGGMAVDGGGGAGGSISGGGGAGGGGGGGVGGSISFGGGGGASFSGSVSGSGGGSGSGGLSLIGNGLTNGKLVIEHICEALGIPHVPPFKDQNANFSNGANFALAGSSALPGSMFLHNRDSILSLMWKAAPHSFDTQLQWFNQFMQNHQHKPDMNKTLFWLGGVGSNDYARIHRASGFSGEWITQHAIEEAVELLHGMVKQGAKYIMVQGLPPLGCLPVDLLLSPIGERDQYGCGARTNKAVMNHNEMLQQKLGELQKQFPHCVIIYADMWKAFMKVLAGFHQFGFVEPFKACCGSGGGHFNFDLKHLCGSPHASVCAKAAEHMIWDGIHFSAKLNKVLAKLFLAGGFAHPPLKKVIKLNLHLLHHLI